MSFDSLTTERLRKYFKNNFDLCNFAISIGRTMVMGGSQSTLNEVLETVEDRAEEREKSV